MGAINTEDAARRLARVILSDIDLYIRERPKLGESREAQIEEGRRLFASRVTPELAPIFAAVLADRTAGRVSAPVAAAAPTAAAVPAIPPTAAAATPSDADLEFENAPATDPAIFVPPLEDQVPVLAAASVAVAPPPPPAVAQARPVAPPPPPAVAQARPVARPAPPLPPAVPQARPVAPPAAPEISAPVPPTPVLTARVSIPRLLAIVSVMAAIVGVAHRFFR